MILVKIQHSERLNLVKAAIYHIIRIFQQGILCNQGLFELYSLPFRKMLSYQDDHAF